MNIGLLLPSAIMYSVFSKKKVFAPKDLFVMLADALVEKGHTVFVYSSSDTKTKGTLIAGSDALALKEPPAMKLRNIPEGKKMQIAQRDARWEYELDLTQRAYRDAMQGKIALIHSYLDFSAHYFAEVTCVPTVYTLHDPVPDTDSLDHWRFQRFPHDPYIAISRMQAQQFASLISIYDTIHHGIDVSQFIFQKNAENFLLFLGRYMKEKGVVDAIEASKASEIPLKIASSWEYTKTAYYRQQIAPLLSHTFIHRMGILDREKRNIYLGKAKALLFPIHWEEPFGMVMIEAMACGTPVIAYARGSVPEVVVDGVTGFIVNETEEGKRGNWIIKKTGVAGLVEAVKRLQAMSQEDYRAMRRACRKHVEEHFSIDQMVSGYERVYEKVIEFTHTPRV